MKNPKKIDIAFPPINLPYKMTPEMVADAALAMLPEILYPYTISASPTPRISRSCSKAPESRSASAT